MKRNRFLPVLLSATLVASALVVVFGPPASADEVVFGPVQATIQGANPISSETGTSVTDLNFLASCPSMPETQDGDAHVFELPFVANDRMTASVTGSNPLDFYDLDFMFYSDTCEYQGQVSTAAADEVSEVPEGAKFIEVVAWLGVRTKAILTVTEAPPPAPDPTPDPSASPSPSPSESPYIRHDYSGPLNDSLFSNQWNLEKIKAHEAWAVGNSTGYGIIISDVDTGLDLDHPDFDCPGKVIVEPGSDTGAGLDDPSDTDGHGTHVQGIAAACANNGEGVAGVAPDARLLPVKFDNYSETDQQFVTRSGLDQAMADGILFAVNHGAHVINLSIGDIPPFSHMGPDGYPKTEDALNAAREAGVVIAAAAGNFTQPTCEFPALSRNVICVVSTDRNDERVDYSDFAINFDKSDPATGIQPVIAAPGGGGYTDQGKEIVGIFEPDLGGPACTYQILSTYWRGAAEADRFCLEGIGYEWLAGTSMAAPHVAGVAALLYDRLGGVRSKANADLIVQAIIESVDDLGAPGYDPMFGYGRLNALSAVQAVTPPAAI